MKKLLEAIKTAIEGEPWTSELIVRLAAIQQNAALAGAEIEVSQRLVAMVLKARRDANVVGKDLVGDGLLLATIKRAREHRNAAKLRLEKAASEFAAQGEEVVKAKPAWVVARRLNELRGQLSDLDSLLGKMPASHSTERAPQRRWTVRLIVAKAREKGLRMTKSRMGNVVTIWIRSGGVTLWEDGSATRADVSADLATRMTLAQAADFLFEREG